MVIGSVTYQSFHGFEEDRATDGGLKEWQRDMQSFEPATSIYKMSPTEAAHRVQAVQAATSLKNSITSTPVTPSRVNNSVEEGSNSFHNSEIDVEAGINPIVLAAAGGSGSGSGSNSEVIHLSSRQQQILPSIERSASSHSIHRRSDSDVEVDESRFTEKMDLELSSVHSGSTTSIRCTNEL